MDTLHIHARANEILGVNNFNWTIGSYKIMSERETSKGGYEVTASIHGSLTLHANNINKEQIKRV